MVYLVDDDIDDLEIVQEALVQNNYKGPVITAENGKILMDKLHQGSDTKPDVILLDLNMPLKDGFEALKEIKSQSEFRDIPVIILTASANKADELRCFELGCDFFYTKPNTMKEYNPLVSMVKKFIGDKVS